MIQKGIVEEIINKYKLKVRVPKYDKAKSAPDKIRTSELAESIICTLPGSDVAYSVDDIVIIGYENDELSKPIVLGSLYCDKNKNTTSQTKLLGSEIIQSLTDNDSTKFYTHVKYSNDNGKTFTSLYNFNKVVQEKTEGESNIISNNIEIDPTSSYVYWSIIDDNNVDRTLDFQITTYITGGNRTFVSKNSLIEIPPDLIGLDKLYLSFKLFKSGNYDNFYIVLTTDKDPIGTTYGDYIGICIDRYEEPSLNPGDYTWMSSYKSSTNIVQAVAGDLGDRINRLEHSLYGFDYSTDNHISDNTGIAEGISVINNTIELHGKDDKNIYFDTNHKTYIDNSYSSLTAVSTNYTDTNYDVEFSYTFGENSDFSLVRKVKVRI